MVQPSEPEFEQALNELTVSLGPFLKASPAYQKALEIVQIPERIIQFRVVWEGDNGQPQVNRGYRVQVSNVRACCKLSVEPLSSTTPHSARTKAVCACILPLSK